MGQCVCGHTRNEEKNCDGTHKVVKAVREQVATEIEGLKVPLSGLIYDIAFNEAVRESANQNSLVHPSCMKLQNEMAPSVPSTLF